MIMIDKLIDGQKITCEINGVKIDYAEIAIENGIIYVIHNNPNGLTIGSYPSNLKGYFYGYCLGQNSDNHDFIIQNHKIDLKQDPIQVVDIQDHRRLIKIEFTEPLDGKIQNIQINLK